MGLSGAKRESWSFLEGGDCIEFSSNYYYLSNYFRLGQRIASHPCLACLFDLEVLRGLGFGSTLVESACKCVCWAFSSVSVGLLTKRLHGWVQFWQDGTPARRGIVC